MAGCSAIALGGALALRAIGAAPPPDDGAPSDANLVAAFDKARRIGQAEEGGGERLATEVAVA